MLMGSTWQKTKENGGPCHVIKENPNASIKHTWFVLALTCCERRLSERCGVGQWVSSQCSSRVAWSSRKIRISGPRVSESVGPGLGLKTCFFGKAIGDADFASPGKTLVEGKRPEL